MGARAASRYDACVTDPAAPGPAAPSAPQPGEAPGARLERPPGERYRRPTEAIVERPAVGRATLAGIGVAFLACVIVELLRAILAFGPGMIVVALLGGWLVGVAVRTLAWGGRRHRPSRRPNVVAALAAAAGWLVAAIAAFVASQALLPASSRTLAERLDPAAFLDLTAQQLSPLEIVVVVLLVSMAAFSARTPDLEVRAGDPGAAA